MQSFFLLSLHQIEEASYNSHFQALHLSPILKSTVNTRLLTWSGVALSPLTYSGLVCWKHHFESYYTVCLPFAKLLTNSFTNFTATLQLAVLPHCASSLPCYVPFLQPCRSALHSSSVSYQYLVSLSHSCLLYKVAPSETNQKPSTTIKAKANTRVKGADIWIRVILVIIYDLVLI